MHFLPFFIGKSASLNGFANRPGRRLSQIGYIRGLRQAVYADAG